MASTWDTSCITATSDDVNYMTGLGLESNISTASVDKVFYYQRGLSDVKSETPVLVLAHGYPQTSFLWRHVVPLIPSTIPLFIPDLPGYGRSSPLSGPHDKRSVGQAILKTLLSILPTSSTRKPQSIILVGHDRGARVSHRLAVDAPSITEFKILGTILLDIIPTLAQWETLASPSANVSSFHWPFLANVKMATDMIMAQGGDIWVRNSLPRFCGKSEVGTEKFKQNNAYSVYERFFKYEHIVRATCDDYRASAFEDIELQAEDQKAGRKIDSDVLVLFSSAYWGARSEKHQVWKEWVGKGNVETRGIGGDVGHFLPEEASEEVAEAVTSFYKSHA